VHILGNGSGIKLGDNSGYGPNALISRHTYIGNNTMMGRDVIIINSKS